MTLAMSCVIVLVSETGSVGASRHREIRSMRLIVYLPFIAYIWLVLDMGQKVGYSIRLASGLA
jgi:hypothetical protein